MWPLQHVHLESKYLALQIPSKLFPVLLSSVTTFINALTELFINIYNWFVNYLTREQIPFATNSTSLLYSSLIFKPYSLITRLLFYALLIYLLNNHNFNNSKCTNNHTYVVYFRRKVHVFWKNLGFLFWKQKSGLEYSKIHMFLACIHIQAL